VRWLITVPAGTDPDAVEALVRAAAGALRDVDPVPLGEEVVLFAEGPVDLPQRLETGGHADLPLRLNPDSEPEPL
jgi:hypothetical protein